MGTRALARHFGVPAEDVGGFTQVLWELQLAGEIARLPDGAWWLPEKAHLLVGTIRINRRGFAFVRPVREIDGEDVYVSPRRLGSAYQGDVVLLRLLRRRGRREGRVVDVIRRRPGVLPGIFRPGRKGGFVEPLGVENPLEIYIPSGATEGAEDGDRVLVRLDEDGSRKTHPRGEVVARVPDPDAPVADRVLVQHEFQLPGPFPARVLEEAEEVAARPMDLTGRRDLRDRAIFTIDPADAKDHDDAISLSPTGGGNLLLGVHIADVSHHVPPGSSLDREARERGTSVYCPGWAIHMLPEAVSAGIASLFPGEDRLTKSVFMTITPEGRVLSTSVERTVIRSVRGFSYEEVAEILRRVETGEEIPEKDRGLAPVLAEMVQLARALRRRRIDRGALDLDIPKLSVQVDDTGRVAGIARESQDDSHRIIEEFMLIANEQVAEFLSERKLPLISRVHLPPDEDALDEFYGFVRKLGVLSEGGRGLQEIVALVAGKPYARVVNLALLRSLEHASYDLGAGLHFALATSTYCHFTSPIRRYPDLVVHQVLDGYLDGTLGSARAVSRWRDAIPGIAEHSSFTERRAEDAERAIARRLLMRYLRSQLGEEMDGAIVGLSEFGLSVEIPATLVEGFIPASTLEDDFYEYEEEHLWMKGVRHGRVLRLGQGIRVRLAEVDLDRGSIRFELVDATEP